MTATATLLALVAAVLHATWNAMVKGAHDRMVAMGLLGLGHMVPGIAVAGMVAAPSGDAIPFIIASTVIHWGYYVFLSKSYLYGDLSFVYPVARGLAPVLVALGALVYADEVLPYLAWVGIVTVSLGILMIAAVRKADPRAFGAAIMTSLMIAAYSVVDGIGIRTSGSPLGYIAWLFIAEGLVVAYVLFARRGQLHLISGKVLAMGLLGGLLSGLAYGLVLYAKTLAPLGIVSAIRETSVIIAALIGIVWFHERPAGRRLAAAAVVAAGIVTLALA